VPFKLNGILALNAAEFNQSLVGNGRIHADFQQSTLGTIVCGQSLQWLTKHVAGTDQDHKFWEGLQQPHKWQMDKWQLTYISLDKLFTPTCREKNISNLKLGFCISEPSTASSRTQNQQHITRGNYSSPNYIPISLHVSLVRHSTHCIP